MGSDRSDRMFPRLASGLLHSKAEEEIFRSHSSGHRTGLEEEEGEIFQFAEENCPNFGDRSLNSSKTVSFGNRL